MGLSLTNADQAYVSIQRVQKFLCAADNDQEFNSDTKQTDYNVCVKDGSFAWNKDDEPYLKGINLKVRPGQLVAIVGYCASGKSSLISALLGEMWKQSGFVCIKGSIAYVPQEAWIQNMSLRDNVLFGKEYNHNRYWKAIENCCLMTDLTIFPEGDKTEIGEKGTNMSGGQKQRLSLARAVYSNADVYLLDDPLSAVDAHVGKDLFRNVIGNSGTLKNKTRLLVMHAIHWLPLVDNIIVMNAGQISECGTYDELLTHNGPFAQFLLQNLENGSLDDVDDPEIRWIQENIREQVEIVTSEGGEGNSSDCTILKSQEKKHRKKKLKRQRLVTKSISQSVARLTTTHVSIVTPEAKCLTTEEHVQEDAVKLSIFVGYVKAMGIVSAVMSVVLIIGYNTLSVYSMFWLTYWTEDPFLKNISNSNTSTYLALSTYYLMWYAIMGIIQGVAVFISYYLALTKLIEASDVLHNRMLLSVMRSPMSFFDTVTVGQILNRFSSDIDTMDNKLPESYRVWINMFTSTLAAIIVMAISTPIFITVVIPAIIVLFLLIKHYLPTARNMRRIEAVTRSPIYNHFSETLTGSAVIKAYKCCHRFIKEAFRRLDNNSTYYFAANTGSRWIAVRLEFLGNCILLASTLLAVTSDTLNGGQLGMSINYAVQITFALNTLVWSVMEMEMNIVSAERVNEYIDLPAEANWTVDMKSPLPSSWPASGDIIFENYSTRYRAGLELVLNGISFQVKHGEKIGVVGRTGAGKSSLALSLFRVIEAVSGAIYIDGVNIADIGLHTLRSKLTILPQDPFLFSGTLRMNADPLEQFTEAEIWKALERSHLKAFAKKQGDGLEYDCGEAGQNLSVGQRQLVCLARTLLNKTKILILDEATAAIDLETDGLIQNTIRSEFKDCTILTIAHRLNTIMDYDKVMVLDKGFVKEFAAPKDLLQDKEGLFYSMAKDAGMI